MSSTTVPNPANGSFPSRSCRLRTGCFDVRPSVRNNFSSPQYFPPFPSPSSYKIKWINPSQNTFSTLQCFPHFPLRFSSPLQEIYFLLQIFPSPPKNIISFSKYPFLPLLFLFLCKKIFSFFQIFSFFSTSTKRCFPSPNISPFSLSVFILLREKTHVFTFSIFHLIHRPHIFLLSKYFALFPSPFFFSSNDLKS